MRRGSRTSTRWRRTCWGSSGTPTGEALRRLRRRDGAAPGHRGSRTTRTVSARSPSSGPGAMRAAVASHLPRRRAAAAGHRARRPGQARRRARGPRVRVRGGRAVRALAGARPRARRRRGRRAYRAGTGRCADRGRARHERVPLPPEAPPALHRAGVRLRAHDGTAVGGRSRRDRLAGAGGHRRQREPVPLLPPHRRRPDPVRRLRRRLPLRRADPAGVRRAAGELPRPRVPLLHDLPAARARRIRASLGRRDRHLLALLRLLRDRVGRAGHVRPRVHWLGRRRHALRGRRDAGPARGQGDPADEQRHGPLDAAAVPARARHLACGAGDALALDRADHREGRRGLFLRTLDAVGLGFDS